MKKITFLLMFVMTIMMANAITTRYIKVTATGTGDGTSWTNAAGTADIQTQIEAVALDATKGEVQFAAGTYLIAAQILIRDGVNLTGGYATDGSGTRDLYNNQTILDGQFNKRIMYATDANTTPAFTKITTINGFILQRGSSSYGSAAFITYGVVLQNCIIRNNNGSTYGSAIMAKRTQSIASGGAGWNMSCAFINCIIINNTSSNYAGGVWIDQDAHFSMINCIIANNKSTDATNGIGGLYVGANIRYSRITNNIFYNNTSAVTLTNRNNYYSPTTNNAGVFSNYFSDAAIPAGGVVALGNKTSTDYASPGFVSPTSYQGYTTDATKITEMNNSNWRLTSTSPLIGLGISTSNADAPYPFSMAVFGGANKLYSSIGTDIMGSNRIIGTQPEMGAYEYNPVVVSTATADALKGSVSTGITVSKGTSVTIIATANTGYAFTNWTDGNSNIASTSASYTFKSAADITLTANFALITKTFTVTVPNGTAHVYIAGDFTGKSWDITTPYELTATATPNQFTGTFACADAVTYKYLCEKGDWDYQEAIYQGGGDPIAASNRTYTASENVPIWYRVKSVSLNATFPNGSIPQHLYVAGSWDAFQTSTPIEMLRTANTYSITINAGTGSVTNKIPANTTYKYFTNGINWEADAVGADISNRWSVAPVMNDLVLGFKDPNVTTNVTGLDSKIKFITTSTGIKVLFDGESSIELFSANGVLINKSKAINEYSYNLEKGLYIIRINGVSTKLTK